jgi:phospholipase C
MECAMPRPNRRDFLKAAGAVGAGGIALPASISRALAQPANRRTGTIQDVKHVVILMQENRSFDHYFGTLRGVRGFGDRHTVPLPGGRDVWAQSNGVRELPPFHLDTKTTNALKVPGTPHSFSDAQAAWNQGKFGLWPKFKTDYSMGYYKREDIPFQFALAEAFTLCDAYHCSVTSGTDPNRVVFWSGSSFDPELRAQGINSREDRSEPNNLRCWIKGALPSPGYTYAGNALTWQTIPEVLEQAGIDWRIYQDPNDNWTGAMHGGLAFAGFRECAPGSPLYERGMSHHSLESLEADVMNGTLPAVSWILPPRQWSEHPSASTPLEGAEFTARVLDALTANPDVWSQTVFFQTFDENDGLFDHLPPPPPPSLGPDGALHGGATFDLAGHYFDDHEDKYTSRDDTVTGTVRPWGLGPRVPMYVVSPWSKGGWVNSEVADHTSVGQFLEARFGVTIPAISPWHRAICSDLTSCFDFAGRGDPEFPVLPDVTGSEQKLAVHLERPKILPPRGKEALGQEPGLRRSRALPYVLHVDAEILPHGEGLRLHFINEGTVGAVFHVYDRNDLESMPRRYTVEAGKRMSGEWQAGSAPVDLAVLGTNGFVRGFSGTLAGAGEIGVSARPSGQAMQVNVRNQGARGLEIVLGRDAYRTNADRSLKVGAHGTGQASWKAADSAAWYDFVVTAGSLNYHFAGRIETGSDGFSDPLLGAARA